MTHLILKFNVQCTLLQSLSSGYSGSTEGFLPSSLDLQQAEQTERWEERLDTIVRGLRANKTRIEGGHTGHTGDTKYRGRLQEDNPSLLNPF